jgi:hypothetical protein
MGDEIKYLDFEVAIKKDGDEYLVQAKSGKGKAQTRFANPFNDEKRKLIRSTVTKAVRSANAQRIGEADSSPLPELRDMKSFGSLLYSEAINGPVSDFYNKCAKQSDRIRLRLTVDQSLDDLPWEFLCTNDDFIALNPDTPVVRYIEGTEPCSLVNVEYPLRVLVVIAKPANLIPLQTDDEKNSILSALKPVIDQGLVKLDVIDGNDTWEKLITELRPNRTHILHFIGHGTFDENGEGVVLMTDSEGMSVAVDSERFRYLMKSRSRLALVVLNSCLGTKSGDGEKFSSVAAGLVKSGVPAVIAMQYEISDDSARVIAKTFYTSLALNMPVDAALTEARLQIFLDDKNNLEWATPILYMQIPDGQLFEFRGPRPKSLSANLDDVIGSQVSGATPQKTALEANARWKDRLYQFGNWFTSTPEVQYQPEPGAKPAAPAIETDVFDRGRQVWNDWFGAKKPSAPMPPKVKPRTLPAVEPPTPTPTQTRPPGMPAQTLTPSEPPARLPAQPPPRPQPQEPQRQSPRTQPALAPSETTQVSSRAEWRIYRTALVPAFLADTIRQYFISQGCESQVLQTGIVWVSQGRKAKFVDSANAGLAATIVIERSGANLRVSIGGGRWLEHDMLMSLRGDPVATLITGPIAIDPQRTLISFLWDIVENCVTRTGSRIA